MHHWWVIHPAMSGIIDTAMNHTSVHQITEEYKLMISSKDTTS
jgi:hypothetical protein